MSRIGVGRGRQKILPVTTGRLIGLAVTIITLLVNLAHAGGGSGGTEGDWKDLIWRTVNFLILAAVLYFLLAGKIRSFFKSRQEAILRSMQEAKQAKETAEKRYQETVTRLAQAEEEISRLTELIKTQGIKERERLIMEANEMASRLKANLQTRMEQELEKIRGQLKAEVVTLSFQLAEEMIKREITPEDQEVLIRDYLEKMAARK